jgi:hypothetical protein
MRERHDCKHWKNEQPQPQPHHQHQPKRKSRRRVSLYYYRMSECGGILRDCAAASQTVICTGTRAVGARFGLRTSVNANDISVKFCFHSFVPWINRSSNLREVASQLIGVNPMKFQEFPAVTRRLSVRPCRGANTDTEVPRKSSGAQHRSFVDHRTMLRPYIPANDAAPLHSESGGNFFRCFRYGQRESRHGSVGWDCLQLRFPTEENCAFYVLSELISSEAIPFLCNT